MNQSKNIKELSEFCNKVGKDFFLVQGVGGNVSYKSNDKLIIKASGVSLKDALNNNIFVNINLNTFKTSFSQGEKFKNININFDDKSNIRPSMETLMHIVIKHKFVIHLHAIEALTYLVRNSAEQDLSRKINFTDNYLIIDYKMPGKDLAMEIFEKLINQSKKINIFLLKNHGIIFSGDCLSEINLDLCKFLKVLKTKPKRFKKINKDLKKKITKHHTLISDSSLMKLVFDEKLFWCLNNRWNLFPDQTVFLGSKPYIFNSLKEFLEIAHKMQNSIELVFIKNEGIFVKKSFDTNKLEQLKCFYEILIRQEDFSKICTIPKKEIEKLINSKDEKYRAALN